MFNFSFGKYTKLIVHVVGAGVVAANYLWGNNNPYVLEAVGVLEALGIYQGTNRPA